MLRWRKVNQLDSQQITSVDFKQTKPLLDVNGGLNIDTFNHD